MAVKIMDVKRESWPEVRFVGKKYSDGSHWGEWWQNGWFSLLEGVPGLLPMNEEGNFGIMRIVDGMLEYWIGMFFDRTAEAPEGFEYVDIEPLEYAVFYLYGNEHNGELYGLDPHNLCLEELNKKGWRRWEDFWCFERYNCPRFTTPDENGNVILDYGISIE